MANFFISDTHFCHDNIIRYCNRPFQDANEMNNVLIDEWNSVVSTNDDIYHLGDVALCKDAKWAEKVLFKLNFNHLHLIKGNHESISLSIHKKKNLFTSVSDIFQLTISDEEIKNQFIVMCHYPMIVWNQSHRGSWNLYGHVHNKSVTSNPNQVNVGIDSLDRLLLKKQNLFAPLSFDEIKEIVTIKNMQTK